MGVFGDETDVGDFFEEGPGEKLRRRNFSVEYFDGPEDFFLKRDDKRIAFRRRIKSFNLSCISLYHFHDFPWL